VCSIRFGSDVRKTQTKRRPSHFYKFLSKEVHSEKH
jgi:hypothetical protein